jgi:ABC-type glycerol-3-phosphate transport system permease component
MPLISQVGRRAWSVRALVAGIYLVLILGAITMAYPFLLMLTMATTGRGDYQDFRLVPRYWYDDEALFRRYVVDTIPFYHGAWRPQDDVFISVLAPWFRADHWFLTIDIKPGDLDVAMRWPAAQREAIGRDLREFIANVCPAEFKVAAGLYDPDSALSLQDEYHRWLDRRFGGLAAVNRRYNDNAADWTEASYVVQQAHRQMGNSLRERDWREFIESRPPERTGIYDANADVFGFIRGRELPADYAGPRDSRSNVIWSAITYDDLIEGKVGRQNLEPFIRSFATARYLSVDTNRAAAAWREFLGRRGLDLQTPLAPRMPREGSAAGYWAVFAQNDCPLDSIRLLRPEDTWRPFLLQRYGTIEALNRAHGTAWPDFEHAQIPYAPFRYDCFLREKSTLRKQYLTHNFKRVFDFVALHGQALKVTLLYVILMIAGTLTVNPLAAYAMSRFRLKETHHVLIFLLATMAFPGEVLMIPAFLLIKSFPYAQIVVVGVCLLAFYGLVRWLGRRLPFLVSATVALVITALLAGWVVPRLAARFDLKASVSLMNTYWALILPGLANGYGIFLLKGFFDTLPPELYEAGLIDGAGELRMFWKITLPLCKPILAVMALGAFTAAYGAFMHAFLICQDPKMWTFMVFLYEFQQLHIVPMIMAALVVAAIPTLLVFIFCQNIILRGIVIPSFK